MDRLIVCEFTKVEEKPKGVILQFVAATGGPPQAIVQIIQCQEKERIGEVRSWSIEDIRVCGLFRENTGYRPGAIKVDLPEKGTLMEVLGGSE